MHSNLINDCHDEILIFFSYR